jgi:hypothetical protein
MSKYQKIINRIAYWTIPIGVYDLLKERRNVLNDHWLSKEQKNILQRNAQLYDIHKGQRCFILATGPSIRTQNLVYLRDEKCFGLSDFYKHNDYRTIKPDYYCLAPLHEPFRDEDGLQRLEELHENGHNSETFFFGIRDKGIFEKSSLALSIQSVYFLGIHPMSKMPSEADLRSNIPSMSSVSIMAICIAIYMGFSEIYLLGCDHDNLWKWDGQSNENQLDHFYEGTPSIGYQHQSFDVDRTLKVHLKVREQYKWVNELAKKRNAQIFNASAVSYINIFPRVNLDDIIGKS